MNIGSEKKTVTTFYSKMLVPDTLTLHLHEFQKDIRNWLENGVSIALKRFNSTREVYTQ